jgi:hypothetical protein
MMRQHQRDGVRVHPPNQSADATMAPETTEPTAPAMNNSRNPPPKIDDDDPAEPGRDQKPHGAAENRQRYALGSLTREIEQQAEAGYTVERRHG